MPVQSRFTWHDPDDPKIWERIREERLAHVLLPHCAKPTRRDWQRNIEATIMALVWARRVPEDAEPNAEGIVKEYLTTEKPEDVPASDGVPWEWAGICYLSNGFGMTPYVHFALFRAWRGEAETIGKEALAWIFRSLRCPAVLGWTPARFKHVEPLLRAWGFKDLAVIPEGFAFAEKDGGKLYFRDGVLRIRKR